MVRGLVVDTLEGHFLRVLGDGTITKAYHGKDELSKEEIAATYPNCKLPVLDQILKDFKPTEEFHLIDNPFECPLLMIYTDLLTALKDKRLSDISYKELWVEIWRFYISFFVPQSTDLAPRFIDIPTNPDPYCVPCSRLLKDWLKRLKAANKYVFLMTSSTATFTKGMLNHILGPDYNDYFDFAIGRSMKPSFFHKKDHPFVDVECRSEEVNEIETGKWYEFGCLPVLTDLLKKFTGLARPKVLYVGDSIKNDGFPACKFADWGSLLILEALEVEGYDTLHDDSINRNVVASRDLSYMGNNPLWGSFFTEDSKLTLFAQAACDTSGLIVPWLDYIADKPLDHRFVRYDASGRIQQYYPALEAPAS